MFRDSTFRLATVLCLFLLFCLDRAIEVGNATGFGSPLQLPVTDVTNSTERNIVSSTKINIISSTERKTSKPTERITTNSTVNIALTPKMRSMSKIFDTSVASEVSTENSVFQWLDIEKSMKTTIDSVLKLLLPYIVRMFSTVELSGPCYVSLLKTLFSIRKLKSWAIKMLDASGKISSGIAEGKGTNFGSYDECLNILVTNHRTNKVDFRGKYCFLEFYSPFPTSSDQLDPRLKDSILAELALSAHLASELPGLIALCVPSTCSHEDVETITSTAFQEILPVSVPFCDVKEEVIKLKDEQIGVLCLLGTILLLVVSGTTIDLWKQYQTDNNKIDPKKKRFSQGKIFEVLKSFSLYTNGKQMLNTKVGSGNLGALHGFRFFTMAWVILAHTYMIPSMNTYSQLINFQYAVKDVSFMAVWNSFLQVDTFFFLTGVTLVYTTMKKLKGTNGRLDLVRYVIHRYWRLTPPLMLVISLMFLLPLLSSGPLWSRFVESEIQKCRNTWWANMFYFSNFLYPTNMCISPYWYLAADMQLYLISPVILITLYKWPRMGFVLITFGILASWVSIAVITVWKNFNPSVVLFDPKTNIETGGYIHIRPYTHLGPYCIGMATGYLLLKRRNIRLRPIVVAIGWIVTTVSCSAVVFGAYDWHNGITPNAVVGIIYASIHRTGFTLGLAWITCACVYGYGGPVNALLSWKPFIVLGRLTYMTYLIHPLIIYIRVGTVRENQFFSHFEQVCRFLTYLVLSMNVASFLHLVFEVPFTKLERFLLPQPKNQKSLQNSVKQKEESNGHAISSGTSKCSSDTMENIVVISRL
ncbi:nose resistant to fluoxetine protein 6-like [Tachypleus tridentatus]|uniref:nose resistant to fluoxetine protein 6-like n=1 Tax=Tachypleus tridentatus TaxID=6853 RepID=UPI003FD1B336